MAVRRNDDGIDFVVVITASGDVLCNNWNKTAAKSKAGIEWNIPEHFENLWVNCSVQGTTGDGSSLPVRSSARITAGPPIAKPAQNTLDLQISSFEPKGNDADLSSFSIAQAIVDNSFLRDVSVDNVEVTEEPDGGAAVFRRVEVILVGVLVAVGGFLMD